MNGRTALYLSLAAVGAFIATMLTVQPYSADWPGTAFIRPARRYLEAAMRADSVELRQLSTSAAPVAWALAAARAHRLDPWRDGVQAWTGERRGDTTEVFVYPSSTTCEAGPIVFRFVGRQPRARVLEVSSSCATH
jgi:hypothetical protein